METNTVILEQKHRLRRERGQGGLVKKAGSKCWYLLYYDLNGKQRSESSRFTVKSKAQELLTSRLESVRKGELIDVRKLRYEHIKAILTADYLASGKLVERDGIFLAAGRKGLFDSLDDFFGGMAVVSITTDKLREFVAKRKAAGASGPTCNRNLALLRRMFRLAQREKKIQNVPYFPMEEESPARTGFVEQKDCQMLRDALPEGLRPFVTFLYSTGCRTGAAKKIVWECPLVPGSNPGEPTKISRSSGRHGSNEVYRTHNGCEPPAAGSSPPSLVFSPQPGTLGNELGSSCLVHCSRSNC